MSRGAIVNVELAEEEMPLGEEAADAMELEDFEIGTSNVQTRTRYAKTSAGWLLGSKDSENGETEGAKEVLRGVYLLFFYNYQSRINCLVDPGMAELAIMSI